MHRPREQNVAHSLDAPLRPPASDRAWRDEIAPAGQLVFPGAPAQLGLDGRAYEPRSSELERCESSEDRGLGGGSPPMSGEAANRSLGPNTGFCTAAKEGGSEGPSRPLLGQIALDLAACDAAPQLTMWERLRAASNVLRWTEFRRQSKCLLVPRTADKDVTVTRHETGAYSLGGLVKCGGWSCAACGPQRARSTSGTLGVLFKRHLAPPATVDDAWEWARDIWMLTLVVPHRLSDDLSELVRVLFDASALFKRSKAWRRFTKKWGIVGEVRVLDATHGGANGAHPHFHIALLPRKATIPTWRAGVTSGAEREAGSALEGGAFDIGVMPIQPLRSVDKRTREEWLRELRNGLVPAWEAAVRAAGGRIDNPTEFRRRSVELTGSERASGYFLKWGLADEIGAPTAKSRSHLRLLDAIGAGVPGAAHAFTEWRRATDGRAWVTGLADAAAVYDVGAEDVAAYIEELRARRAAELAAAGEAPPEVRPLRLAIPRHLYAGAIAVGWTEVFRVIDEADARGADVERELHRFLWCARLERAHASTAPPD